MASASLLVEAVANARPARAPGVLEHWLLLHLTRSFPPILPFRLPLAVYRATAQPPDCAHPRNPWLVSLDS
jgi:hypothetical protein